MTECPIPGHVQGEVGCGFEQPSLVEGIQGCWNEMIFEVPSDPNLSVIL